MERAGTLINKLKEQYDQQASAEKLAITAQMLLVELQQTINPQSGSSHISVVLPKVRMQQDISATEPQKSKPVEPAAVSRQEEPYLHPDQLDPAAEEIPTLAHQTVAMPERKPDLKTETIQTAQSRVMEFNSILANQAESLNERLRENRVEVASTLQETPIRDLKKAIGLNDRFLFVNELFRGDENMYERSLKTINGFTIYPEAEYWIQRELKVKLGWT
ncbi:MAG: hypothetical protein KGO92_14930, partial [Bacteroidota bacterium]|nr:hypothetical protein [Bacteroidota bacterium]